jgi:hypothetical protein
MITQTHCAMTAACPEDGSEESVTFYTQHLAYRAALDYAAPPAFTNKQYLPLSDARAYNTLSLVSAG